MSYICKCLDEKDCAIECVKARDGPNAVYIQPENTVYFNPKRPTPNSIRGGPQMISRGGSIAEIHKAMQAAKKENPNAPRPNIVRV